MDCQGRFIKQFFSWIESKYVNRYKLEKLPNLPIRFEEGSCYAYTSSDAMICSSKYYEGTSNAGRECYHTTDGKSYKPTGYLQFDHHQGKMVRVPQYSGEDSVMMIGGKNPECRMEEYNVNGNGAWLMRQYCGIGGVVGFRKVLGCDFCQQQRNLVSMNQ